MRARRRILLYRTDYTDGPVRLEDCDREVRGARRGNLAIELDASRPAERAARNDGLKLTRRWSDMYGTLLLQNEPLMPAVQSDE